ncbi:NBR1-Ig-like domain-containing protein [Streptosporangium sp. NPDC001681]|uniref:NBR1-Ig-like domain-containing protein n=1 Tax=Streptosporangium sp. NPDC001681 TaxID=3154395 RepID=UPI00332879DA
MAESPNPRDGEPGTRRGRKPVRPDPESGPVALLAHRLWKLKEEAGDPSFAEMSSRLGAAASKSSLAAAARGQVLPSWETTWEFVRVLAVDRLGQDPAEVEREWREHWERARSAGREPVPAGAGAEPGSRDVRRSRVRKPVVLTVLSAVVAGGAGALIAFVASSDGGEEKPVPQAPLTHAASPRDDSAFEGDVTHPDGTVVRGGTHFTKVWRLRNSGTIPWHRRYLDRMNETPCHAPERVAIETTAPGETVDIAVRVRAADSPGRCKIYWKMTNEDGAPLFAGKNPIFLDVTVK